jgi:hypothetical protein
MNKSEFHEMLNNPYYDFMNDYCNLFMNLCNESMIEDTNDHDRYMHQRAFNNYKCYDV